MARRGRSSGYGGDWEWPEYVPVAERRRNAEAKAASLAKKGQALSPVKIAGTKIAGTFWGKAWCANLEAYSDFASRLPRGRSYVRNGCVIDLQVARGAVRAKVHGTSLYDVRVTVDRVPAARWKHVVAQCAGKIDSLVELLQGKLSSAVMQVIAKQGDGLFPSPGEIRFECSCPDGAYMCKHVAAALYGVGARLDAEPEVLFALRGVDPAEMIGAAVDAKPRGAAKGARTLAAATDLGAVFGIELDRGSGSGGGATGPAKVAAAKKSVTKATGAAKKGVKKAPRRGT